MLGFGPPADRRARQEWWRRQVERQQEGGLSVAQFCRRLGVSTVTFYAWKRRFRGAPPATPLTSEKPAAKSSANGAATPAFLPVSMLDGRPNGQLEIALANACILRLTGSVDPVLLRVAIRTAGRLGDGARGAD